MCEFEFNHASLLCNCCFYIPIHKPCSYNFYLNKKPLPFSLYKLQPTKKKGAGTEPIRILFSLHWSNGNSIFASCLSLLGSKEGWRILNLLNVLYIFFFQGWHFNCPVNSLLRLCVCLILITSKENVCDHFGRF